MIITIDGPAASGKSTVAQMLAKKLSFYYLNSGLLYRALAHILVTHERYTAEQLAHPRIEHLTACLDPMRFCYDYDESGNVTITFDGNNITPVLKDMQVSHDASIVSADAQVRDALLHVQHRIAAAYHVVIEGRDTGSHVFPHADYKFFLTASPQERAHRWQAMQEKRGTPCTYQEAFDALKERDARDEKRELAPLRVPEGAVVIDSTFLNSEQVVQEIMNAMKN